MVEIDLCLGQSVVDFMRISNLSTNIYYYTELGSAKINLAS